MTDHEAVQTEIKLNKSDLIGRGTWKNNSSIYNNMEFSTCFKQKWIKWITLKELYATTHLEWWILIKSKIKNTLMEHAKEKRRKEKIKEKDLRHQLEVIRKRITKERGVRQGDNLSMILFTIAIDPLLQQITKDTDIVPIKLKATAQEFKTPSYADDLTLTVKTEYSIYKAIQTIENFGRISGLQINPQKTQGIQFGKMKKIPEIIWKQSINILGHQHGYINAKDQWINEIKLLRQTTLKYQPRRLTMEQKRIIVNSKMLPIFLYKSTLRHMTKTVKSEIKKQIMKFCFEGKENIDYELLVRQKNNGGYNIIDIPTFVDIMYIATVLKYCRNPEDHQCHPINKTINFQLGYQLKKFADIKLTLNRPHTWNPEQHWAIVVQIIKENSMTKQEIQTCSNKEIYQRIVKNRNKWKTTYFANHNWNNIHSNILDENDRTLNWKIAHKILPSNNKPRIYFTSKSKRCTFCKSEIETEMHLFTKCKITCKISSEALNIWAREYSQGRIKPTEAVMIHLKFHDNIETNIPAKTTLIYLTTAIKRSIWTERNKIIQTKQPPSIKTMLAKITAGINYKTKLMSYAKRSEHNKELLTLRQIANNMVEKYQNDVGIT
ncbi:uncharacterized protein LOC144425141 [Styela clava]